MDGKATIFETIIWERFFDGGITEQEARKGLARLEEQISSQIVLGTVEPRKAGMPLGTMTHIVKKTMSLPDGIYVEAETIGSERGTALDEYFANGGRGTFCYVATRDGDGVRLLGFDVRVIGLGGLK
jgi:hypothetical protein